MSGGARGAAAAGAARPVRSPRTRTQDRSAAVRRLSASSWARLSRRSWSIVSLSESLIASALACSAASAACFLASASRSARRAACERSSLLKSASESMASAARSASRARSLRARPRATASALPSGVVSSMIARGARNRELPPVLKGIGPFLVALSHVRPDSAFFYCFFFTARL
eukprot:scaffold24169_cov186-Isochrysis_galbana.AAC.2